MDASSPKETTNFKATEAVEKAWLSIHLKVNDIAKPLMFWYGRLLAADFPKEDPAFQFVRTTLRLWEAADGDITRHHRKNAISSLDPKSEFSLDDPRAFSSKEANKSLGEKFLNGGSRMLHQKSIFLMQMQCSALEESIFPVKD